MNRRERLLLFLVGGVLGLGLTVKLGREQVLDRLNRMDREIDAKRQTLSRMEGELQFAKIYESHWQRIAKETLATDSHAALARMIDGTHTLATRCGLQHPAIHPNVAGQAKGGYTSLTFTVDGDGDLKQMVTFLHDLHNAPFLPRVRSLTLTPLSGKQSDKLRLALKGETIVLPPNPRVPNVTTAPTKDAMKDPIQRTAKADVKEYLAIAEKRPFEPYKEPPRPPEPPLAANAGSDVTVPVGNPAQLTGSGVHGKGPYKFAWSQTNGPKLAFAPTAADTATLSVTGDTIGVAELELKVTDAAGKAATAKVRVNVVSKDQPAVVTPTVARKFDPARSSTRVTGLLSAPDVQEVVLTGNDKKRRVVRVGEEFDGGTLIYVHPEGAVVVYNAAGMKEPEKDFYPHGKLMSEMTVLADNVPAERIPPVVLYEVLDVVSRMNSGRMVAPDKGSGG